MKRINMFRDGEPETPAAGTEPAAPGQQDSGGEPDWKAEAEKARAQVESERKRLDAMKTHKSKAEQELAALKKAQEEAALTAEEKAAKIAAEFEAYKAQTEAERAAAKAWDETRGVLINNGVLTDEYQNYLYQQHLKGIEDPAERSAKVAEMKTDPGFAAFFGLAPTGVQHRTPAASPPGTAAAGRLGGAVDWKAVNERAKASTDSKERKQARAQLTAYYQEHGCFPD